jgi:hypothetical protein
MPPGLYAVHPGLPSRTDVSVPANLTVPILGERWGSFLLSAGPPVVSYRGHVALRQTEIGQIQRVSSPSESLRGSG